MSKLSFRARALDATKSMPVYRKDEVADLPDYSVLNRAVPQMPTGMEKEEESEHHLQRAISAQQVYGDKKVMVIPVPEAEVGVEYYNSIYKKQFRLPKQYIHNQAQALNSIMEQEKPDYDMDSDDERWVRDTNKRTGLEISNMQFEEMIDRLEKSCGNQIMSLQEAKLLLKEDDDLIKAVYDYWRAKSSNGSLTYQVRQERRDGSSSGDSYVAFRRRTEKMQTRKNRKNDEASYEKMLKLRRDLTRAVTILEMVKRREKCKWELLHLTLEVAEKRYQMKDWDGKCLKMAKREVAIGQGNLKAITGRVKHASGNKSLGTSAGTVAKQRFKSEMEREKKRKSKKNKDKLRIGLPGSGINSTPSVNATSVSSLPGASALSIPLKKNSQSSGTIPKSPSYSMLTYQHAVDTMSQYEFHSSDEDTSKPKSPVSGSVTANEERKKNPDGIYAFRRKPGCKYEAPRDDLDGDHWPWMTDEHHRYSLTTLTVPEKCMGFCRRRVGRGGRTMLDRAYTPWNKQFSEIDLHPDANHIPHKKDLQELLDEIKRGRWRRYRPYNSTVHKSKRLSHHSGQRVPESVPKPFGHISNSTTQSGRKDKNQKMDANDSDKVDVISVNENLRSELLHKRLLSKAGHMKSPQKSKSSPQKRVIVHGRQLDKPSALFAVSALVTSDSPLNQKSRTKVPRSHQVRLSMMSSASSANSSVSNLGMNSPSVGGMTLISNIPGQSPSKYMSNIVATSQREGPATKKSNTSRLTPDQAKLQGIKGQEKVRATLMPVTGVQPKSSTATSVTLTVTGPTSKVSLTPLCSSQATSDGVSLTMMQPGSNKLAVKGVHSLESVCDNTGFQKSVNMPVVMATLRIGNPSTAGAISSQTSAQNFTSIPSSTNSTYGVTNQSNNASGPVYIASTTRGQPSKSGVGEIQVSANLPLTLSTVNSTTLVPSQYKHQHGVLNLALTPANSQKHGTLSQLSIPNSSGHTPTILIATPAASGTVASGLAPHCSSSSDVVPSTGTNINLSQAKTVSINVARVQTSSSGVSQIFALQQHPDSNIGPLTVTSAPPTSQNTGWVQSGGSPNILKLGPPGSLHVISKLPRGQQAGGNTARTISITNSKQPVVNHTKIQGVSPQITLIPDNRPNISTKPFISITPKNNATVVLSAKNMPLEQTYSVGGDTSQTTPAPLGTQSDNIVSESTALNSKASKTNQPMEVT